MRPSQAAAKGPGYVLAVTRQQRGVLAATGLGLFLVFLDAMIANLALPDIQQHFGGGESTMQWVVIAYSIGMALFIMPSGTWADRRGRRFVFTIAVVVFMVGSLASGFAPAFWVLVGARFVQGVGAAAITVTSLALVSAEFKDDDLKARAIGIWTGIAALGLGLGPTLGGVSHRGGGLASRLHSRCSVRVARIGAHLSIRRGIKRPHQTWIRPGRPSAVCCCHHHSVRRRRLWATSGLVVSTHCWKPRRVRTLWGWLHSSRASD